MHFSGSWDSRFDAHQQKKEHFHGKTEKNQPKTYLLKTCSIAHFRRQISSNSQHLLYIELLFQSSDILNQLYIVYITLTAESSGKVTVHKFIIKKSLVCQVHMLRFLCSLTWLVRSKFWISNEKVIHDGARLIWRELRNSNTTPTNHQWLFRMKCYKQYEIWAYTKSTFHSNWS